MIVLTDVGRPSLKVGGIISISWFWAPRPYDSRVGAECHLYIHSFSLLLTVAEWGQLFHVSAALTFPQRWTGTWVCELT